VVTLRGADWDVAVGSDDAALGTRWVFLAYRLPREPSAPRLALWRAVQRLGALQVSDGLVALPHSSRNLEHVQWLASAIVDNRGSASVWLAQPLSARMNAEYEAAQRADIDAEYQAVLAEARKARSVGPSERDRNLRTEQRRAVRRLRGQLRRIGARDYFAAPSGEAARAAVERLARADEQVPA